MIYTTAGLIADIKRRASIPTNQPLFEEDDFIQLANDELDSMLVPLILSVNEEHYVVHEDMEIQNNVSEYVLPGKAVANRLRAVGLIPQNQTYPIEIPRLTIAQLTSGYWSGLTQGGFYLESNNLHLFPTPVNTGNTLRLFYYSRPLPMCSTTLCAQITGINVPLGIVTVASVPGNLVADGGCTVVQGSNPFGTLGLDVAIGTIVGNDIELIGIDASTLQLGDWVCPSGYSCVAQTPQEAWATLSQSVAVKCLEALGDDGGMKRADAKLEQLKAALVNLLAPRVDGSPKKLINQRGIFGVGGGIGRYGGSWF